MCGGGVSGTGTIAPNKSGFTLSKEGIDNVEWIVISGGGGAGADCFHALVCCLHHIFGSVSTDLSEIFGALLESFILRRGEFA